MHFLDSNAVDGKNQPSAHHRRFQAPPQSFNFIRCRFAVFGTRGRIRLCARRACVIICQTQNAWLMLMRANMLEDPMDRGVHDEVVLFGGLRAVVLMRLSRGSTSLSKEARVVRRTMPLYCSQFIANGQLLWWDVGWGHRVRGSDKSQIVTVSRNFLDLLDIHRFSPTLNAATNDHTALKPDGQYAQLYSIAFVRH